MWRFLYLALIITALNACSDTTSDSSQNTVDPSVSVLAIGDSICTGYGLTDGWASRVATYGYAVSSECKDGRETVHVANSIEPWINEYHPTHLVIMLGSNDAIRGSIPDATRLLNEWSAFALQRGIDVIISTLPPITRNAEWDARSATISDFIKHIPNVTIADVRAAFEPATLADGIHPDDNGQAQISGVIIDALSLKL